MYLKYINEYTFCSCVLSHPSLSTITKLASMDSDHSDEIEEKSLLLL